MRRFPFVLFAALVLALATTMPARAAQPYSPSFHSFPLDAPSNDTTCPGTENFGVSASANAITLASSGLVTTEPPYQDNYGNGPISYAAGRWTSPWFAPAPFSELVASWNADTPAGTWIEVRMQAITDHGTCTKFYVMGEWAYDDGAPLYFRRTSIGHQGDADGYIAIDTFFAKAHPMTRYRLKLTLFLSSVASASATPTVTCVGAIASDAPNLNPNVPSPLGGAEGVELAVPRYSQEIHTGEYPQFDGGGEAWCSPTSTSMILGYWGKLPPRNAWSYVYRDYPNTSDAWVDYAARFVYDYHYQGAGNWPFNTAYAAHWGLRAFVTQLRSLREAEQFIRAGIPLVASLAFNPNQLSGFLFDKGTNGHLLTIVGFDTNGNVISNDPASTSDATVRHVYDRAAFEKNWLSSTGGIVYVLRPASVALPPNSPGNW